MKKTLGEKIKEILASDKPWEEKDKAIKKAIKIAFKPHSHGGGGIPIPGNCYRGGISHRYKSVNRNKNY